MYSAYMQTADNCLLLQMQHCTESVSYDAAKQSLSSQHDL